jgi:hypothetical protein
MVREKSHYTFQVYHWIPETRNLGRFLILRQVHVGSLVVEGILSYFWPV